MAAMFSEFRQLFRELGNVGAIGKRARTLFVPVIGVSGVTIGGLFLHKRVTELGPAPTPEEKHVVPSIERRRKIELPSGVAEKVRAAASVGCPVEIDCIRASRAGADFPGAVEDLVAAWEAAGYFKQAEKRTTKTVDELLQDSNGEKLSRYGKDIHCQVATQNAFDGEFATWDEASLQHGLHVLEDRGHIVIPQTVSKQVIHRVRDLLGLNLRTDTYEITTYVGPEIDCDMINPSVGRRHFLVRESEVAPELSPLYASITPLVQAYLSKHRSHTKPYLSEMQVVVTDPLAVDQFWHRDNVTPGLTVAIPLTPVPRQIGLTSMLPYSHRHSVNSVVGDTGATLQVGDALVYDARILHRGKRNELYNKTRVMIVFRFDFEPPPGQGFVMTAVNAGLGRLLSGLGKIRDKLPDI